MIKAAVCDDERYFTSELHHDLESFFSERNIGSIITEFYSGKQLIESGFNYDVIFLDVRMDERDGFETAKQLRRSGFSGCLIFVTVMKNDMYRAFEYGAFDYLVKPVSRITFTRTLERFLHSLSNADRSLIISRRNEQTVIKLSSILYCEIINRKVNIHLASGNVIEYYDKISTLESKLGGDFFKSHRSYLVNLKHVSGYGKNEITLDNNEMIPLSRGRKSALMNALLENVGGDR